jgi:polyhydroxyalkanoate synthesis regulator phasin
MRKRNPADAATTWLAFMKEAFGAAVEATAKVQEQALRFFDDLAKRGGITQQEGKRMLDDWIKASRETLGGFQKRADEVLRRWEEKMPKTLTAVTPASKQDVQELSRKIEELAKKVEALSRPSRARRP